MLTRRLLSQLGLTSAVILALGVGYKAYSRGRDVGGSPSHNVARYGVARGHVGSPPTTPPKRGMRTAGSSNGTGIDAPLPDDLAKLTHEQRAQIQPMLDSIEAIEEVAAVDGNKELAARATRERSRLVSAVAGLQGAKAGNQ